MQIFNTLTRQKEEFVPQVPGEYRIYVCGPTVYNYIHIGNARPLIVFDTLRRYLEYRGNKVIYVSNITDIDDKLIRKGQEEGTSMKEVAQRFEAEYLKDAAGLNCKKPTVQPRATEHIQQILDIVKDLIDSGHAYVAKNGDVYFRVKSDPEYGKLSHLNLDDLESGNRELRSQMDDDLKEDPADFAVWKAAKPGEPAWESPYGMGRPGWHIECSAMSRTHLGKTIDLHCGGQDLIFPHHENEIAQSECANGCEFARYWMHNGFINVDNQKMSKSLHNFFTVRDVAGVYRVYVCGPTVYNYIHIGNARQMIVFDTLRRYLEYCGNKVYYVSNITDIDDKLIKKGQEEGTSMQEVARKFEAEYIKDSDGLNVKAPTVRPRATEHIGEIIHIVKDLVDSGHAYVARNGDVYFRVKSDPGYGKLSHLNLDDLESGNRALRSQMDDDLKEDPADFAVWKAAKPGEPYWESPWGHGRPGWHIECSAMARKHLGKTIDLHAGGQDLIFPHHENEIAQSECANGCTFSRYWMHNGFLNINNEKMSKSANNFFTVREIADKYGYEPIRYFMLTAGYRMPLNYTVDLIESCKNSLERMYTCRDNLDFAIEHAHGTDTALAAKCEEARTKFKTAMDDDLNTPDALAAIFDLVKDINTLSDASDKATLETAAKTFDELTGVLGLLYNRKKTDAIPAEVTALVEERAAAKKAKDWGRADAIRAQLTEMGWSVTDTAQGPKIAKL